MYMRVALRKPAYCMRLVYIILTYTMKTRLFSLQTMCHMWVFALQPAYTYCIRDWCLCNPCIHVKNTFFEVWVVWVVMQLTPLAVTTFPSTLFLQQHIDKGREVHERGIESMHWYAEGIGTLFAHTFSLEAISLCCRAWRLSSLEKRSSGTRSRFHEVPNLKRRYICTSFHD